MRICSLSPVIPIDQHEAGGYRVDPRHGGDHVIRILACRGTKLVCRSAVGERTGMSKPLIRTLIVDDSVFMRTVLKNAMTKSNVIEVVGTAQNGQEALEKIRALRPDVVTLDIEMPGINGLEVLRTVMQESPLPVVMVSTKTQDGAKMTFEALELGAVDYVAKPLAEQNASMQRFQEKVTQAVETAHGANLARLGARDKTRILKTPSGSVRTDGVVAIGISAGGPATLHKLVPTLPKNFPPVVLAQHMPASFTGPFAQRLNSESELEVREAAHGEDLRPGQLLIAPGDRHLRIRKRGEGFCTMLDDGPKVSGFRPSVDVLFQSVAQCVGRDAIGLVMTGMGSDGADGIRAMKAAGATTLSQDRDSCIVYGMPKAAFETGCVDRVVSLAEITAVLTKLLQREPTASRR